MILFYRLGLTINILHGIMKQLYLLIVLLLFSLSSQAQQFNFGAAAGVNIANITGSDLITGEEFNDMDSRTSFHIGLVSEVLLGGNLFLAPELLYSAQGTNSEEIELKLNYLQIPIMGRYYFTEGLNVELGPQFGILLNSSGEINNSQVSNENFESSDILIAFGVGYKLPSGFFVRGRYFLGSNVAKGRISDITGDEVIDVEYFNKVAQISLGYMFK